ncbi:hypothetical protein DOTSEDRAFT_90658 [Dothistroma septosporum NZE10]|uniref:Major facilitator superfamily (MFS) profile domain-containing protein n=1 Tax=Dothistroma septosporum (strain NZE10 / CBS 128990) TaxID=675120 RepID=N1PDH2_DOTSN|nr:hypothetical protein DOTSEDRAFT_90658 [Dothistroma septosporum NZE10]
MPQTCPDHHIRQSVMSDAAEKSSKDSISSANGQRIVSSHQKSSPETARYDIISFADGDQDNPYSWSNSKKLSIIALGSLVVLNTTFASSLPSGGRQQQQQHFHVTVEEQLVLPNSVYLIGYILGPFLFAPLSENYGRRFIVISTFICYAIFMMATALAPNWAAFNVFRLLTGIFGSTPISVTGGLFSDVLDSPVWRGRSVAWFMAIASFGPNMAPIAAGYLSVYSWRWPFWFALILAGISIVPLLFLPETFGPAILAKKAKKLRKENPGTEIYASLELKETGFKQLIVTILGRPLRMLLTEPIVTACCLWLSIIYAINFMLFQAFDQIFPPIYGFSSGETGLAFLGISVGCFLSLPICFWWDYTLRKAKASHKTWAFKEEYQRLPLAIIGGPLFTISMFWIGWSARRSVHYIVPILGGLPLGIGFVLIFVALANYLVDSYKIYSASALGATSIARSTFGVVLPFAAKPMYDALGVPWACSLLGFFSLAMCAIPFVFIQYGPRLRTSSPMCQELARMAEQQAKVTAAKER